MDALCPRLGRARRPPQRSRSRTACPARLQRRKDSGSGRQANPGQARPQLRPRRPDPQRTGRKGNRDRGFEGRREVEAQVKMKFVDEFAHTYVLDIAPDWPQRKEPVVLFPPDDPIGTGRDSFRDIRFYPRKGESWIARFEAKNSGACRRFSARPITSAAASRKHALIVVTTWTDVVAYRSAEPSWRLQRIADDSLRITALEADILTVSGFVRGEDDAELKIDLVGGKLL